MRHAGNNKAGLFNARTTAQEPEPALASTGTSPDSEEQIRDGAEAGPTTCRHDS